MRFYLGVLILLSTVLYNGDTSFIYGQPCSVQNTAYLRIETWEFPDKPINCVDVTGFKKNMHGKINLNKYKEFFQIASQADTLYSDHSNLTKFPILIVKSLPNIELIDLSGNKIRRIPPKIFKYAPKIKKLLLSNNKVVVPKKGPLVSSPTLQTLMLSNNKITNIYKFTFRKLPNLEVLYLDNNSLQNISPLFGSVPHLKFLHVGRNYLSVIPSKEEISQELQQYITKSQKTLK